jgi:hypothetical protein
VLEDGCAVTGIVDVEDDSLTLRVQDFGQLEAQIDELEATIESCRKIILAGRIAVASGGVVLFAIIIVI